MAEDESTHAAHDGCGSDLHRRHIDRIDKTIAALLAERRRHGRALTSTVSAAYQGSPGAFSETAAIGLLGGGVRLEPHRTLEDVFDAVVQGRAQFGVVPIENSLAGSVPGCADLLGRHDVHISAERIEIIQHALIAPPGVTLADVRRVLSHPVAIGQCEAFFHAHPDITAVPTFDTAGAVAEVMSLGATDAAAIASRRAADVHGGVVIAEDLQDRPDNSTRFLLIQGGPWPGVWHTDWKTTLLCILRHEPGALVDALLAFSSRGLNLCRIESRPTRETPFEYGFHLDIGPAADVGQLQAAIEEVGTKTRLLRVLGHYEV